jgi:hypothetical protein
MQGVRVERLDHLGIVAGICREIGLAAYGDALGDRRERRRARRSLLSLPTRAI